MLNSYKIVLVGDISVGKTSIIDRYIHRIFDTNTCPTIGACYKNYIETINGEKYNVNVWDSAGNERYRSIIPIYYRNTDICIFVFDLNEINLESINKWVNEFKDKIGGHPHRILLVGNKSDLLADDERCNIGKRMVLMQDIITKHNMLYVETSAKTGDGIDRLFENVRDALYTLPPKKYKDTITLYMQKNKLDQNNSSNNRCASYYC